MASTTYQFTKAVALTDYMPSFIDRSDKQSWEWDKISTKKSTSRKTEQIFSYYGLPSARQTNELQPIHYADMGELPATTFTMGKYTLATAFSYELAKYNKHIRDLMKEAGKEMGDSHAFVRDVHAAAVFNRAFNSSYTMFDSTEMCGTHTLKSGDSFTNKLTTASYSYDNLWTGVNSFETSMLTQSGRYMKDTPKYVLYHPSNNKVSADIFDTKGGEPGTADNTANTILSQFNLVPIACRFLSTSTNWFILGERFKSDFLWFTVDEPKTAMEDSFDLMATKMRSHQIFGSGMKNFTHCFGNVGA